MIARLTGHISEVSPENLIMDVGGVGYELTCSAQSLADIQSQNWGGLGATTQQSSPLQKKTTVFVYTHVREDILQLFGFSTLLEKSLFLNLLKVNGIGPKMAINILSGATSGQLEKMIEMEDVKALSKLPKVGKKTAEQMILTLKGKLVSERGGAAGKENSKAHSPKVSYQTATLQDISSALVNLGFRPLDVFEVVSKMSQEIELQEGIRQGLFALGKSI